ncbi:hypothetical protein GEMRC1_008127 [Eukaryota sp. GEM-RC1]
MDFNSVVISDAFLCLTIAIIVFKLFKKFYKITKDTELRSYLWISVLFFIFSALGASAGSVYHAFEEDVSDKVRFLLWCPVKYFLALTTYFTARIVIDALFQGKTRHVLSQLALIKTAFYIGLVTTVSSFLTTAVDFGFTTLFAIIVCLTFAIKYSLVYACWFTFGWVIGLLGVILQVLHVTVDPTYFNNNDLFHLCAAISSVFVYVGISAFFQIRDKMDFLIINENDSV